MPAHDLDDSHARPAGYAALIARFDLDVMPNWHTSLVATRGGRRVESRDGTTVETYAQSYWPGESLGGQLEFALKYDGTNLGILARLFEKAPEAELVAYVRSKPTGKYARRLWFLFELLTEKTLPLKDLKQGNYVPLLEPKEYFTLASGRRVQRQRINDNLLGGGRFCPTVRRTDALREMEEANLPRRCREVMSGYSPALLKRALGYLYTRETKSSFEIESIQPSSTRTQRFVALLRMAEQEDFCRKPKLVEVQNRIVDERFLENDYRSNQNYVGETVAWQQERIDYASPKPEDLTEFMEGLEEAHERMGAGSVSAVIHAAVIAYGFVFLHPFEDGNGRIHRFLVHNILARRGYTPEEVMFPVSASMLKNPADYDRSLEAFSRALMPHVEFTLDDEGRMTVHNETASLYRCIDMTPQAEALFRFVAQTINTELVGELEFLANYDRVKRSMQEIIDLPDRQIDLFIRFCLQNNGRLSARKRASRFPALSDDEVSRMEEAVKSTYGLVWE